MKMDYITFRSITPAQRGQRLLRNANLETWLQRTPRWMAEHGCGYCLRSRPQDTEQAEQILRSHQVPFSRIYHIDGTTAEEIQ